MENAEQAKPGPKLSDVQREQILEWLAAEHSSRFIMEEAKRLNWGVAIDYADVSYYRVRYGEMIAAVRQERHRNAILRGLANKDERIAQLVEHADELAVMKWKPDEKGRYWNEKAWRETLADIAAETGGRVKRVTMDIDREVEQAARRLAQIAEQAA